MKPIELYDKAGILKMSLPDKIKFISVSSAVLSRSINNEDIVKLSLKSGLKIDFSIGDYIIISGRKYKLNEPASVVKSGKQDFAYNLTFESVQYDLLKVLYCDQIDQTNVPTLKVPLFGTIDTYLQLLRCNLERVYGAGRWQIGSVLKTDLKNLVFENETCLSVLQKLCKEFETEFDIEEKSGINIINVRHRVREFDYLFRYGQGRGLYNLSRENVSSPDMITRLYAFGSEENLGSEYRKELVGGTMRLSLSERLKLPYLSEQVPTDFKIQDIVGVGRNYIDIAVHTAFNLNATDADGNKLYIQDGVAPKCEFILADGSRKEENIEQLPEWDNQLYKQYRMGYLGSSIPNDKFYSKMGDRFKIINAKNCDETEFTILSLQPLHGIIGQRIYFNRAGNRVLPSVGSKIRFVSGDLSGYEFEITDIDNLQGFNEIDLTDYYEIEFGESFKQSEEVGLEVGQTFKIIKIHNANNLQFKTDAKISSIEDIEKVKKYGVFESYKVFEEISPGCRGKVFKEVEGNLLEFEVLDHDGGISVDWDKKVNEKYINRFEGVIPKVHFNSGDLAGYEFYVEKFIIKVNIDGKINQSRFLLKPDQENGLPNDKMRIKAGDKYVLLDVKLPEQFFTYAENQLYEKACQFLNENSSPKYGYSLTFDEMFIERLKRERGLDELFDVGDYLKVRDEDIDLDKSIRIISLSKNLLNAGDYTVKLSEKEQKNIIGKLYDMAAKTKDNVNAVNLQLKGKVDNEVFKSIINKKLELSNLGDLALKDLVGYDDIEETAKVLLRGSQGVKGDRGDRGLGFRWRGEYNGSGEYFTGAAINGYQSDIVSYLGNVYVCKRDNDNGRVPSLNSPVFWELMVSKGEPGAQGLQGPTGIKGDTGAVGPKGDRGFQGAFGPKGSGFRWRGEFDYETDYFTESSINGYQSDVVFLDGSVYLCIADTKNRYPGWDGGMYWQLMVSRGVQGVRGDVGAVGPKGATGAAGVKGDTGAKGDQGAGFRWKGEYNSLGEYFTGVAINGYQSDVVSHLGNMYVCKRDNNNGRVPSLNSPVFWELMVSRGAEGVLPADLYVKDNVVGAYNSSSPYYHKVKWGCNNLLSLKPGVNYITTTDGAIMSGTSGLFTDRTNIMNIYFTVSTGVTVGISSFWKDVNGGVLVFSAGRSYELCVMKCGGSYIAIKNG